MGEKSINVVIANRTYPVSVQEGKESDVHTAARLITDMLREFEANYSVKDKQDLLAMCALQLAAKANPDNSADNDFLSRHLSALTEMDSRLAAVLRNPGS